MSEGQGFARRVTLENLPSFAPLLKSRDEAERQTETPDTDSEGASDTANERTTRDPAFAAAEALFAGEPVRTGIRFSRSARRRSGRDSRPQSTGGGPSRAGTAQPRTRSADVLLMRVRPRRDGTQLQISMKVHQASFMKSVQEVVSEADGSVRGIGYDYVKKNEGKAPNLARFEAPEMDGMTNPVARFRWEDERNSEGVTKILRYKLFDADKSKEGARIFEKLSDGIAEPPLTDLSKLSRDGTVLSKSDRESAQWYRLEAV